MTAIVLPYQTVTGFGETNTASNVNVGGVGVFKQKTAANLEFKGINNGSTRISVTNDAGNNEIDVDAVEANFVLSNIGVPTASVNFNQQQGVSFAVENRTSDPGSPVTGQIWLRTDL